MSYEGWRSYQSEVLVAPDMQWHQGEFAISLPDDEASHEDDTENEESNDIARLPSFWRITCDTVIFSKHSPTA